MIGIGIGTHRRKADGIFNTQSVLLDGVDEYIDISGVATALASTTVGTWSFWVKPVDATPAAIERFIMFGDAGQNRQLLIGINTDGTCRATYFRSPDFWELNTDAAVFSNDTWTYVTLAKDVAASIRIDGIEVPQTFSSGDGTQWFNDNTLDVGSIGRFFNSVANISHFNGNMDEILFINRGLSVPQTLDIFNSGSPKDESNIANGVSYFRIDNDIVNTATDSIGSNDGTYNNVEQADIEEDTP